MGFRPQTTGETSLAERSEVRRLIKLVTEVCFPGRPRILIYGSYLTVKCFELTAASGRYEIWTFQLPAKGLFSHFLVLGFCLWDKQNSVKENLPISSDIYTFSNLKASFIMLYLNWYPAAVALDWDLLNITFSKETYDHLNFAIRVHVWINSTQWTYCSGVLLVGTITTCFVGNEYAL